MSLGPPLKPSLPWVNVNQAKQLHLPWPVMSSCTQLTVFLGWFTYSLPKMLKVLNKSLHVTKNS